MSLNIIAAIRNLIARIEKIEHQLFGKAEEAPVLDTPTTDAVSETTIKVTTTAQPGATQSTAA